MLAIRRCGAIRGWAGALARISRCCPPNGGIDNPQSRESLPGSKWRARRAAHRIAVLVSMYAGTCRPHVLLHRQGACHRRVAPPAGLHPA
uniref:hypothetical protein n=1 Tax=Paraburkholderia adhaesiva TaxID=2883244 RepID=UPI001F38202F|nr:hypothetical protein [Paraburkholderia adhaesiva]